jgi:hypothetical protein
MPSRYHSGAQCKTQLQRSERHQWLNAFEPLMCEHNPSKRNLTEHL